METIRQLFIDSLNGFSLKFIPFFLLQLFSSALLAYLFQFILRKKTGKQLFENAVLTAVSITLLVSLVKYSLPFSVIGAAVIVLFLKKKSESTFDLIMTVLLIVLATGCGIGSIIQTAIGFLVICSILLFLPLKSDE